MARADDTVARDGQEGAAQRVEMRCGRRVGMGFGAQRCVALALSEGAADALLMPGLPVVRLALEVSGDIAADVGIGARVAGLLVVRRAGIVDVVVVWLQGSKTTFSKVWLGCSVAMTRSAGS